MSTKKETPTVKPIILNGKDVSFYFGTLTPKDDGNYTASIEVMEYLELGYVITSLISVCRSAIENKQSPPDPLEISRALEIAQNLIPLSELEFLDEIKKKHLKAV